MSRRCQLIEEQEFELVRSIRGISPVRSGVKGSFDSFSALASNSVVSTSIQALSIDGALTVVKEDRIIATTTIASNTGASQTDSKASLSSALDAEMVSKKDEDDEYYAVL